MRFPLSLFYCSTIGIAALLNPLASDAQLRMNEICQSNIHLVFDAQEFPDSWVELHNPTSSPVNLN